VSLTLTIKDLRAGYGAHRVLQGVNLEVGAGESVALLGPNGAGKSTLINAIMGMCSLQGGTIYYGDDDLGSRPPQHRVRLGIGLVPEGRHVWPTMSVRENLMLGGWRFDRAGRAQLGDSMAEVLDIFPRLKERMTVNAGLLSGGEQQMLTIGRAMMSRPSILLIDEPSIGLAPKAIEGVMDALQHLKATTSQSLLLVEQRAHEALALCDRAHVLNRGRIVAGGTSAELASSAELQDSYFGLA
jgi:branched-chain amino acid transport system ATP-binding protein